MGIISVPTSCRVYTPADLAQAIVCALGDSPSATWLEPSHGKGAFVEAIARTGVESGRIVAIDLDVAPTPADRLATTLRGVDFVKWAAETDRRFDRIVGNPPFISISQLPTSLQSWAASTQDLDGKVIGKGANLWYAFVLASVRLLRTGGCLAFILPSAAEFADYCCTMRRGITERFGRLELYRCGRPLFDDVQEGTLVAVGRDYGLGTGTVSRRSFNTRADLMRGLSASGRISGHSCPDGRALRLADQVTLGSISRIGLGGVTGDARYFLMSEPRRASLRLPNKAFTPVVSKAKHLRSAVLAQGDWDNLKAAGERIWLFNPSAAMVKHPHVRHYLELEHEKGGCNREAYKVSIRKPWYCTPMPSVPDAFLSGMSQRAPWLCINETQRVNATNTLYVVRFTSRERRDWYKWALALLTSEARRRIRHIGRRYPDGLIKYEPGSISRISLPKLRENTDHKRLYIHAVAALLSGKAGLAREIADSVSV